MSRVKGEGDGCVCAVRSPSQVARDLMDGIDGTWVSRNAMMA